MLLGDLLEPGLTVVAQDPVAVGEAASDLLFRRLDGDAGPTQLRVIPTRLDRPWLGRDRAARDGSINGA